MHSLPGRDFLKHNHWKRPNPFGIIQTGHGFGRCVRFIVSNLPFFSSFLSRDDFYEGVTKLLVSKTRDPKWTHEKIEDVTQEEVDEYFKPLGKDEEFKI